MPIHPTAILQKGAEIDPSAQIGPFCIIGPRVKIGPKTILKSHVVVENHTTLGARNLIHPHTVIGGDPQDKKYEGEEASLVVGDDNVIREGVTLNIGTAAGNMQTTIGSHCLLMAYSHVAHDCILGDHVILANGVALAGHVTLDDHVILGGLSAVHQFVRIGRKAFVGGGAMVGSDVPPFCVVQGDRATVASLNLVGLRRAGWPRSTVQKVHKAMRTLFFDGMPRQEALVQVEAEHADIPEALELCAFVRAAKRGVCAGRKRELSEA